MLYGGGASDNSSSGSNQYKTSVIDSIIAEVQNVPGEDRCVILAGYKDQMLEMFQVCLSEYSLVTPDNNSLQECEPRFIETFQD